MEKWWNVTFCLGLFHIQAKRREDETDGNTFDNFYHTGLIFHVQSHFLPLKQLSAESMLSGMSWVASLVLRSTSCLASKARKTWETKYFYSTISEDLIYHYFASTFHMNPFISCCLQKKQKSPLTLFFVSGWEILTWYDKWSEFHGEQRNVFVIFVKEDERDRHREWNAVIENTPQRRHAFSLKNNPLVIWMKRASRG